MAIVSLLLFLTGCTFSATAPTPTPTSRPLADINPIVASHTPSPTQTMIPATPTASPTASPTATLTTTSSPTPTATEPVIAISTPPGTELTEQVRWLYETNNGCQFPCWWGITPGETTWSIAETFFDRFDKDIYTVFAPPNLAYYGVLIPLPVELFGERYTELGIVVEDDVVTEIGARVFISNSSDYLTQYRLPAFLTTYGQPAEVWVSTYSAPHADLPFRIVLFYPTLGIAALYSDNGLKQGDIVHGCPQQEPPSFLSLWDASSEELTFEEISSNTAVYNVEFLSLEEATGMDVTTFYQTFKNPDNLTCLETPSHLWPSS